MECDKLGSAHKQRSVLSNIERPRPEQRRYRDWFGRARLVGWCYTFAILGRWIKKIVNFLP